MSCKDSNTKEVSNYICPNGCENGACKPSTQPSITITSPNGGETITDFVISTISWQSTNAPAGSVVGLYVMGTPSASWPDSWGYALTAIPNLPTSGSFQWTPRISAGTSNFKIKAMLFASGVTNWNSTTLATDESNALFSIAMPSGVTRSLTVTYPAGGESLNAGSSYAIRWNSSGIDANA